MSENSMTTDAGWMSVVLSQIADVRVGRQRSPSRSKGEHMRPYIRAANITWDGISVADVKRMDFSPQEYETYSLRTGDILLSEASGSASEVGKAVIWNEEIPGACFQNTVIRVRTDPSLTPFLYWTFRHAALSGQFAEASKGVGIHHLGGSKLSEWMVRLPTVGEQNRIVAKLQAASERIKKARISITDAQNLLKQASQAILDREYQGGGVTEGLGQVDEKESGLSLLDRIRSERRLRWEEDQIARFSRDTTNDDWKNAYRAPNPVDELDLPPLPSAWCWTVAEEIVEPGSDIVYGIVQPGPMIRDGVPYVRGIDIQDGRIKTEQLLRTTNSIAKKYGRSTLQTGDVLLGIIRATKVAIVPPELDGGNITQGTARFRPSSIVTTDYLAGWLSSPYAQNWLHQHYRGVDMPGLNLRDVRRLPVPLAPLYVQKAISVGIKAQLVHISLTVRSASAVDELLESLSLAILNDAFQGRIASHDLSDEPLAGLLSRLKDQMTILDAERKERRKRKGGNAVIKPRNVRDNLLAWLGDKAGADFSFDEIREAVPTHYDDLKDAVFSLIDDPKVGLEQYFDTKRGAIRLRNRVQ